HCVAQLAAELHQVLFQRESRMIAAENDSHDLPPFGELRFGGGDDAFGREAKLSLKLPEWRRSAKGLHADRLPCGPDVPGPAERRRLLDGDPRGDVRRQHAILVPLVLFLEQLPRRHAHHTRPDPSAFSFAYASTQRPRCRSRTTTPAACRPAHRRAHTHLWPGPRQEHTSCGRMSAAPAGRG